VSPEPRVSCVIFDIDGTLTRTNELIFSSFNHVASKYIGRTLTPREITALFGPPEEVAIARVVGHQDAPAAMSDLCSFYRDQHRSLASLHDGIEEVLRAFDVHPRETLMIGDTVSDVRSSQSAGVRMAAVLWDSYDKERLLETSTDLRFFEVAEMFAWFRSHLN
jgi:phosphoglycolate phosphatase-like HAD superfamily hydrolase